MSIKAGIAFVFILSVAFLFRDRIDTFLLENVWKPYESKPTVAKDKSADVAFIMEEYLEAAKLLIDSKEAVCVERYFYINSEQWRCIDVCVTFLKHENLLSNPEKDILKDFYSIYSRLKKDHASEEAYTFVNEKYYSFIVSLVTAYM